MRKILKNINLTVKKGEICVILGKNGAGESTLFKILLGLTPKTTEVIKIFDKTLEQNKYLFDVGSSINTPIFYENLSDKENLEIHSEYMECYSSGIEKYLKMVGLDINNTDKVKHYSLGMRQRLVLERALINNPKLLIFDEPLNGLDPKGIKELRELLVSLANLGKTIVMSSHILSEVEFVATKIAVLASRIIVLDEDKYFLRNKYGTNIEDYLIEKMEE